MAALHPGYGHELLRIWQSVGVGKESDRVVLPVFARFSADSLVEYLRPLVVKGLRSILVFGVVDAEAKTSDGRSACDTEKNPALSAIALVRRELSSLYILADVCVCPFTSSGHCGIFREVIAAEGGAQDVVIDQEKSLHALKMMAVACARAGAHCVAPSDMMDNRVKAIKEALADAGFGHVPVMSYSSKFASSFYGPFRDAAKSAPAFGDRSAYQLPVGSNGLAVRASLRDEQEGADFLMVKPGMPFLDIIRAVADATNIPIAVYQVSGEYAMLHHGAAAGALDLKRAAIESYVGFRRAGAAIVITYFAPSFLEWLS